MSEPLMTLAELADMLGVPLGTLYQWRHRGVVPPVSWRLLYAASRSGAAVFS
jgi:predicted site-specific integrase-resolvase